MANSGSALKQPASHATAGMTPIDVVAPSKYSGKLTGAQLQSCLAALSKPRDFKDPVIPPGFSHPQTPAECRAALYNANYLSWAQSGDSCAVDDLLSRAEWTDAEMKQWAQTTGWGLPKYYLDFAVISATATDSKTTKTDVKTTSTKTQLEDTEAHAKQTVTQLEDTEAHARQTVTKLEDTEAYAKQIVKDLEFALSSKFDFPSSLKTKLGDSFAIQFRKEVMTVSISIAMPPSAAASANSPQRAALLSLILFRALMHLKPNNMLAVD